MAREPIQSNFRLITQMFFNFSDFNLFAYRSWTSNLAVIHLHVNFDTFADFFLLFKTFVADIYCILAQVMANDNKMTPRKHGQNRLTFSLHVHLFILTSMTEDLRQNMWPNIHKYKNGFDYLIVQQCHSKAHSQQVFLYPQLW